MQSYYYAIDRDGNKYILKASRITDAWDEIKELERKLHIEIPKFSFEGRLKDIYTLLR